MPKWITKKLPFSQWGAVQFRVEIARQEFGQPLHLALLVKSGDLNQPDDVFVLVPDESLKTRFPGFSDIAEHEIPTGLTLLVGPDVFAKRFPDVAAKLRTA
jgi:hypothetical protein